MSQETQAYCKEILAQLNWMGRPIVMSWGAHDWTDMGSTLHINTMVDGKPETRSIPCRACLRFKVQGRVHKGFVYVVLTGSDDYTIILTQQKRRSKGNNWWAHEIVVSETPMIYCDNLAEVVDRLVETPAKVRMEA